MRYRTVARRIDAGDAGFRAAVGQDAAVHRAARRFRKAGIGAHADRDDQHVKRQRFAVLKCRAVRGKARYRLVQEKPYALRLHMRLDDARRFFAEHVWQDARRKVDDRDRSRKPQDALGAFQADQPRAYDQHPFVLAVAEQRAQPLRIVERHEAGLVFHAVQPFDGGDKRARAGRKAQPVKRQRRAVVEGCGFAVKLCHRAPWQRGHAVFFIKIRGAVEQHVFLSRFALQQVRDQRPAVRRVRLGGYERDRRRLIH